MRQHIWIPWGKLLRSLSWRTNYRPLEDDNLRLAIPNSPKQPHHREMRPDPCKMIETFDRLLVDMSELML